MPDDQKTKAELIEELKALRSRIALIEQTDSDQPENTENAFMMAFNNAPDGMLLANAESKKLRMGNAAVCEMLGYTEQELVRLGVADIHPAEDLPFVISQFEKQARGEILVATDIPVKRKDGSVFYADVSSSLIMLSGRSYLMGIFRDVTDRRNTCDRNEIILKTCTDGFWLTDTDGQILEVNEAYCRMSGYSRDELLTMSIKDVESVETPQEITEHIRKIVHRGTHRFRSGQRRKNGAIINLDINTHYLDLEGGRIFAFFRDITEQTKAEEALQKSEEKFRLAMETTNDALWDWNITTNEVYRNPRHASMLGYEPHEFASSQDAWESRVHPDDKQWVFETLEEHLAGKTDSWRGEYRLRTKSGDYVWVLGRGRVVTRNSDGAPVRMIGTNIDITEQREAEEQLRASEEKYKFLFDSVPAGIGISDLEGNVLDANRAMEQMTGYTLKELGSMNVRETYAYPEDRGKLMKALKEHGKVRDWAFRLKRKDGSVRHLLINADMVERDGKMVLLTTSRDITDHKKFEDALRESEKKYRTLINNIPDVVWTSDSEGNSTFVSPNVERIYGFTPQEICEQRHDLWLSRVHPNDLQRVEKAYRALLDKNQPFDVEYRIQRKDGRWIWLNDRSIATYERDGAMYADGVFSDITFRKVVDIALRESQTNLARAQQIAHIGSWERNLETGTVAWSDETYRLLGFEPGSVEPTFEFFLEAIHPQDRESVRGAWKKAAKKEQPHKVDFRIIRADGVERVLDSTVHVIRGGRGRPLRVNGTIQDITERRRSEQQQTLRFHILEALHQQTTLKGICTRTLSLIKADMDCDAAALRMKDGDDYPYFVNDGFSQEFIQAENLLLGHEQDGGGMTNPDGTPALACMCGVVLDGRFDQNKPFFASKASFWTNSLSSLLESTSTADRCGAGCKTCNEHGYESVALIPIESEGHILGLLQVNAKRKNLFSLSTIQFLEELALLIGVACERKKAEQALKQSEEKFRRITEQGFDVVFTAALDGALTYASPSVTRVFGFDPREVVGKNVTQFLSESNMAEATQQLKGFAEGKSFSGRELEILRKDGSAALIELNSTPIRDGDKIIGAQASARDITERRRVENALRESEEKYRTLVESAGESILSIDENGVFLFMNTTGAERLGGKPEDYIGKSMWDLFPKEIADGQMAGVRRVIDTCEGLNTTAPSVLQDQMRWYNTTIEPLINENSGKANAVIIIARDIHDMKQAQDELAGYREKMAHADMLASLGTLSATVAHELTQPLTVIRLSLDNLLDELKAASSPETVTKKLENSLVEISNITSIINRFRTFARKSSVKTVDQVKLKEVAERIIKLLGESAKHARISLQVKDMDQLPLVKLNERDFEQLFFALVQNAIQAADGKKPRSLTISGLVKDQSIELRFTDDCGGIAPDDLNAVFQPFFTTKPPGQGTGLGLCIVRDIASRAGGKISLESEFGKGSTFIVTLPDGSEKSP